MRNTRTDSSTGFLLAGFGLGILLLLASPQAESLSSRDDTGKEINLSVPARRIVALAPHVVEILFEIGAGGHLVGVVEHSDFPASARSLPRVGGYSNLDLEAIFALKPQLVVAWREGNPPDQLEKIKALGIPVFQTDPVTLEDVPDLMPRLGRLAGTDSKAKQAAAAYRTKLDQLRARYRDRTVVRVFYQIWNRPLMTVGGNHLINAVITLCGGENVFSDLQMPTLQVGVEAVIEQDPLVIVASGMGKMHPEWLDTWRRWDWLLAVRGNHLHVIEPDILQRHGPRVLQGAQRLCEILDEVRGRIPRE